MQKKETVFSVIAALILFALVFGRWFGPQSIIGGDWPYRWPEYLAHIAHIPTAWALSQNGGLGGIFPAYFLIPYNAVSAFLSIALHIPWIIVYKVFWFAFPVLSMGLGGYVLFRKMFCTLPRWTGILSSLLCINNTYYLMIASGGQMGVFVAVSLTPWVVWTIIHWLDGIRITRRAILMGVAFGAQLSWDPRIACMSGIVGTLCVFVSWMQSKKITSYITYGLISVLIAFFMNAYWILPVLALRDNPLERMGNAYVSTDALKFFSFADFSHAISLLHPNWPENIFGKTYFLQPEFILLPILAFASLLFVHTTKKSKGESTKNDMFVISLSLLSLIGAFFAKGANPPFGNMYIWMFEHVPGFMAFRDPSKFYLLTMLGYAFLIPYAVYSIWKIVHDRYRISSYYAIGAFFLVSVFLMRQALIGSLPGTFTKRNVPSAYMLLAEFLSKEPGYFRTLWIPRQSRFAYESGSQNPIESEVLFNATDSASLETMMKRDDIQDHLSFLSVRYIIVPADPYGEIFQDDRTYSETKRNNVIAVLDAISWLTKVREDDIVLYKTPESRDIFWASNGEINHVYKISDDLYTIIVKADESFAFSVSQTYHPGWRIAVGGTLIEPEKTKYGTMEFSLPEGSYRARLEFVPRYWFMVGRHMSLLTLIGAVTFLGISLLVQSRKLTYNGRRKKPS